MKAKLKVALASLDRPTGFLEDQRDQRNASFSAAPFDKVDLTNSNLSFSNLSLVNSKIVCLTNTV